MGAIKAGSLRKAQDRRQIRVILRSTIMVTRPVAAALSTGVAERYLIPRKMSSSCFAGVDWARRWRLSVASASGESECWFPGRNRACRRSLAPWSGRASPVAFALSAAQAHGFLSSTPDLVPLYRAAGSASRRLCSDAVSGRGDGLGFLNSDRGTKGYFCWHARVHHSLEKSLPRAQ